MIRQNITYATNRSHCLRGPNFLHFEFPELHGEAATCCVEWVGGTTSPS